MSRASRWLLRPARIEDVPVLVDLVNSRYRRFTGEDAVTESGLAAEWENPRVTPDRDLCALVDGEGCVRGWAGLEMPGEPYVNVTGWVSVALESSAEPVTWGLLLEWVEERAREVTSAAEEGLRTCLTLWAVERDVERQNAYERLGYASVRAMRRMRADLAAAPKAPVWPEGLVLTSLDPECHLRPLAAASREAFRDHWGHVPLPVEEEEEMWRGWLRTHAEGIDPAMSTLAWAGDDVAGYSLGRWHLPLDRSRGVVASLAVRPAWRRRGLGSALLHETLGKLREKGCTSAELMVDSGNQSGALRLYERAGFAAFRTQLAYEKELRPGRDIIARG
ncbi:MAG: GNAT family N-acetyltransferase [Candidatus Bipolaricaulota bacterium]